MPLADGRLSYSQRFTHTEWGAPIIPAAALTFDQPPKTRKWSAVAMALIFGILVVTLLVTTLMIGTGGTRRRTSDASAAAGSSLTAPSTPVRTAPAGATGSPSVSSPSAAPTKPKPGAELRDALLARLDQPNLGMHTDFTMHLRAKGTDATITGSMDIAPPNLAAIVKVTGGAAGAISPAAVEVVLKDGIQYTRVGAKSWQRSAATTALPATPFPSPADLSGLQYVGVRQVSGQKLHLYRATTATLVEHGVLRNGYLGKVEMQNVRFEVLVTPDGVPVTVSATITMLIDQGGTKVPATMDFEYRISRFGEQIDVRAPTTGGSATG